jgi:hypothetical protein
MLPLWMIAADVAGVASLLAEAEANSALACCKRVIASHTRPYCNARKTPYIRGVPKPGTAQLRGQAPSGRFHQVLMSKKSNKRKTVDTLERHDCRWPIGDPREGDFHFCGARQLPGRPYCELHWRMAFQPPRSREAQPPAVAPARRAA